VRRRLAGHARSAQIGTVENSRAGGAPGGPAAAGVRRRARWLPAALIAAGIAVDLSVSPAYTPAAIFAAVPLVSAALLGVRATVAYAVAAAGTLLLLFALVGTPPRGEAVAQTTTVFTVAALAVGISVVLSRSRRRLVSARGIAAVAQLAVVPEPPGRLGPLDVAARYEAAEEDALIGGDLYAAQETPHGVRLLVGDVRGKGLGSVEAVVALLGTFREAAEEEATLEGLTARLERALEREAGRREGLDRTEGFTTAAVAEVPSGAPDRLRLLNRGHPPPLLLTGGATRYLEPAVPALPLGLGELGARHDRVEETPFPPGAQLLLYTDGLSEARDADNRFYDPAARLSGRTFPGPGALLDALVEDVRAHSGGVVKDDMALLAVRRGR
jgi:serine phosphatase RsbU (regulator of sigma subunit)